MATPQEIGLIVIAIGERGCLEESGDRVIGSSGDHFGCVSVQAASANTFQYSLFQRSSSIAAHFSGTVHRVIG
ncbi:MAG TPA: hypothetical protein VHA33_11740 [Candidatus Angelobacter sp.]|nr:hypothetical protein [Candidatus Angelobacter sp.]